MNPPDSVLRRVLSGARSVAVVGLSDNPERDSHGVAQYLHDHGYRVIPVNPLVGQVLGERSYPTVAAIPPGISVDIVDIFRRPEEVPAIMDAAIQRKVPAVWMQLGISQEPAAESGRDAGLVVVENSCIMTQHRRLGIGPVGANT